MDPCGYPCSQTLFQLRSNQLNALNSCTIILYRWLRLAGILNPPTHAIVVWGVPTYIGLLGGWTVWKTHVANYGSIHGIHAAVNRARAVACAQP